MGGRFVWCVHVGVQGRGGFGAGLSWAMASASGVMGRCGALRAPRLFPLSCPRPAHMPHVGNPPAATSCPTARPPRARRGYTHTCTHVYLRHVPGVGVTTGRARASLSSARTRPPTWDAAATLAARRRKRPLRQCRSTAQPQVARVATRAALGSAVQRVEPEAAGAGRARPERVGRGWAWPASAEPPRRYDGPAHSVAYPY